MLFVYNDNDLKTASTLWYDKLYDDNQHVFDSCIFESMLYAYINSTYM